MGHGYKGDTGHHHSIGENIAATAAKFPYRDAYFGESSPDSKERNRNIKCGDLAGESKDFYDTIAYGGIEKTLPNGKGVMTEMSDGSIVSFREVSSSDRTPVAEINIKYSSDPSGVKGQKIHFIRKGKE